LGDRTALPALLELMASEELPLRLDSSHVLTALTGERFGYVAYDKPEARQASLDKWQAWLASDGGAAPLKHPLPDTAPMLGRTLVASYQQAMVIEYDAAGKETWRLTTGEQPWSCQGLPDGHRLVAFHANGKVVEYDGEGKEVWKREGLGTNIFAAQRLENGNTLLVVSESNQILEFKSDQQAAVWQATVPNRPMDAKRLENGNTLVCCANSNEVVEIDAGGTIVWRVPNMNGPIKAQRLENGNTLVVQMNTGAVVEVERDGKEVWRLDGFSQPYDAQRLPTGGTLIVDNSGLHEYDEQRKKVDTKPVSGGSGVSRF
jgi:hypothetical protein